MTVGSQFPTLTPGGLQEWWVINQVSRPGGPRGPQQSNFIVVESSTRPVNAVAGPFTTKADAEAWQTSANTAGNSPGSALGGIANAATGLTGLNALGDFAQRLTQASTWVRVGEVTAGLLLLFVGAKAMFPSTVNMLTSTAKKAGKAAILK